jgi:RNA polymerase sigma factor (sigma-70 family)
MEHRQPIEHPPLDEAIIPLHFAAEVAFPEDQKPIPIAITGPSELTQDERTINIKTQLLAYNALLLCRDRPAANSELRSFGLNMSGSTLRDHLDALSQRLCELTGEDVLDMQGSVRWRTYMLSPRLQLTDERNNINSSLKRKLQQLAVSYPEKLADFSPTHLVTFKDKPTRQRALAMTIRDYSACPEIRKDIRKALESFPTVPGSAMDQKIWHDYQKPSQEKCEELFTQIEYGLAAAILHDDPKHDIQAATDMVAAYHQLYFSHLFMVKRLAGELCDSRQEHQYLFEIGSAELIKAIMNYKIITAEGSAKGTFASLAYETIKQDMIHYRYFDNEMPYDIPKSLIENRRLVVKAIDNYISKYKRMPANSEVAQELELTADRIKMALYFSFRGADVADYVDSPLDEDANRFEDDLRSYMAEMEIHDMFSETDHSDSLTDREKVVLSLRYAIFVPGLAGTEISAKGKVVFTYPHSVESLPQFAPSQAQIATMLGSSEMTINRAEKTALLKARRMLSDWGVVAPETDG